MKTTLAPVAEETPAPAFAVTVKDLWQFLKRPVHLPAQHLTPAQIWRPFLQLCLLKLLVAISLGYMAIGILKLAGFNTDFEHAVVKMLKEYPFAVAFLLVAVVGPVIEEVMFRYPLRYTKVRFMLLFGILSLCCIPFIMEPFKNSPLPGLGLVLIFPALAICFLLYESWQVAVQQWWHRSFAFIFYSTSVVFSLIHIFNFENPEIPLAWLWLLVLPQLSGGLMWGYIRMKYGLKWAMAGHGLSNAVLVILSVLT